MIYLDYNATTPIAPAVLDAMLPYFHTHFGNPSSSHSFGQTAQEGIANARHQLSCCLNCSPTELVFMSGGTESINMLFQQPSWQKSHFITSIIEHVAVLESCKGLNVTYIPVNATGHVDGNDIVKAIRPDTKLISIMHSNNEIGSIQNIESFVHLIKSKRPDILFHTDASQSVGKVCIDVKKLNVDYLTIAGHKLYAPKGIGALYIKEGTPCLETMFKGAGQEQGLRPGTENVPYIVGLGKAAELISKNLYIFEKHLYEMKKMLCESILSNLVEDIEYRINGHNDVTKSLPNTLSISFKGIESRDLLHGTFLCSLILLRIV